jgi:hypothetical protein
LAGLISSAQFGMDVIVLDVRRVEHMETKDHSIPSSLKFAFIIFGSVGFLIAGLALACIARHYQITDQPMPNGKGGFMTFGDGYLIAFVLFLISVAWFMTARRLRRSRDERD